MAKYSATTSHSAPVFAAKFFAIHKKEYTARRGVVLGTAIRLPISVHRCVKYEVYCMYLRYDAFPTAGAIQLRQQPGHCKRH